MQRSGAGLIHSLTETYLDSTISKLVCRVHQMISGMCSDARAQLSLTLVPFVIYFIQSYRQLFPVLLISMGWRFAGRVRQASFVSFIR
jgi:hypothetical protein